MLEFGLTGGIGSGKSTVGAMFVARGAILIDADAIVRRLQQPGEPVFDMMVERWGHNVLHSDGTLDRPAVAAIVFSDDDELGALNAIVHPAVTDETQRILDSAPSDAVVIHDIPLLVQPGGELLTSRDVANWGGVIVVDTPEELAVARVVASRDMLPEDVEARMAAQASRSDRRGVADYLINNAGSLDDLTAQVDACWAWMSERAK